MGVMQYLWYILTLFQELSCTWQCKHSSSEINSVLERSKECERVVFHSAPQLAAGGWRKVSVVGVGGGQELGTNFGKADSALSCQDHFRFSLQKFKCACSFHTPSRSTLCHTWEEESLQFGLHTVHSLQQASGSHTHGNLKAWFTTVHLATIMQCHIAFY